MYFTYLNVFKVSHVVIVVQYMMGIDKTGAWSKRMLFPTVSSSYMQSHSIVWAGLICPHLTSTCCSLQPPLAFHDLCPGHRLLHSSLLWGDTVIVKSREHTCVTLVFPLQTHYCIVIYSLWVYPPLASFWVCKSCQRKLYVQPTLGLLLVQLGELLYT